MNQRKQNGFIGFQFFTQLLTIRRLYLILIGNKLCTQEVLINLRIQIFTVCNDKECKVARTFMLDLTGEHNHRIALATTLSMPEYTQLAFQFLTMQESIVSVIYTKELVILCNDLCSAAVVKNEVLYVIQQIVRFAKTGNKILQTGAVLSDSFSVRVFFFVLHLQPFKEELITCRKATQASFHTIRQNTNLIIVEQIWDVLQIVLQIDVIGVLHRNITVFQFNENHRESIDEDNQIRSAPMGFALDPHLRSNRKCITQSIIIG